MSIAPPAADQNGICSTAAGHADPGHRKSGPRGISILGSTGSIGRQSLQVVERHPERLHVAALAAGSNVALLAEQASQFRPSLVAIADESLADELRDRTSGLGCRVAAGPEGLREVATAGDAGLVVAGMVGAAGLLPTLAAIDAGKDVAFANKEVLVCAGALVTNRARLSGSTLLPVDSEHSAIFQCLHGQQRHAVRKIILTASGGPFARLAPEELEAVTASAALQHPTWKMGDKITVDCATLMNKGLEVMEARWLFDIPPDQIEILIHHQSVVHSLVEFEDGSVLAQLGWPSMILPIQYGLLYPDRAATGLQPLDLAKVGSLTFAPPDFAKFPALGLARHALASARNYPAALNAANEVAVRSFLDGRLGFTGIAAVVEHALAGHTPGSELELDAILQADAAARQTASAYIASRTG